MKPFKPRVLILTGDGLSGQNELAEAFALAGFEPHLRHINDLISEHFGLDWLLSEYQALGIPGGASFGDHIACGKLLALKIQGGLGWDLNRFAERGGMVMGVGNGFQILLSLQVFGRDISFTQNASGEPVNTWMKLHPQGGRSPWLRGAGTLELPVRQRFGRIVFASNRKVEILTKMERQGMMCLRYDSDPSGSESAIAGLCDPTGRILGLMPHPELYTRWTQHPEWTLSPGRASAPGQGLLLFENAYQEVTRGRI